MSNEQKYKHCNQRIGYSEEAEYSQDFVDKKLLFCCFARCCFYCSVDRPFNLTAEQSLYLSFSVFVPYFRLRTPRNNVPLA